MAIARWMTEHPDADWVPLWYLGLPIQNAYPPLLPILTATLSQWAAVEPAAAYHWLSGAAYALGPASLYLLARTLGLAAAAAGAAALGMSLLSPAALLFPSVWTDLGNAEGPRRLDALTRYGEGPHVLTLMLWPLAVAALHKAVERRTPIWVGLAAIGAASVALTNWLGSVALAAAAVSLLLAQGWSLERWRTAFGVGALGYALACPWLPISTILTVRANSPRGGGDYAMGPSQFWGWLALLIAAPAAGWLLARWAPRSLTLRFAALLSLLLGVPVVAMEATGFHLMPQPHRFQLELEQGLWLLIGAAAASLVQRFGRRALIPGAIGLTVLAAVQAPRYRSILDSTVEPVVKQEMLQYKVARALADHNPQARLFAAGSVEYWLNVFADNPQVGGVFDQGVLWEYFQTYRYGVGFTKDDGERTARWLRALGVDAVFVSESGSREPYRGFWRDPLKFRGVFEEIWREGGDVLYEVPGADPSLAQALTWDQLIHTSPSNYENEQPIANLDQALLDSERRRLTSGWTSPDHLVIEGEIRKLDRILVQIAWHPGWDAAQDSLPASIRPDALGMIVIEPEYASERIDLRFKGTTSFYLNDGESLLHHSTRVVAVLIWLAWLVLARRRW